jgi:hypothetical protein
MDKQWVFSNLSLVVMREEIEGTSFWVVQCLEHDVAAQGAHVREAMKNWEGAFMAQAMANIDAGNEPMANVPRAPSHYFRLFRDAVKLSERVEFTRVNEQEIDAPPPWMIKAFGESRLSA